MGDLSDLAGASVTKTATLLGVSIHSFIMPSVNPYKVKQPIGYRTCHNINVL
jgi:hypothetical protein